MTVIDRPALRALAGGSLALITANQAGSGAFMASPTFPVYRYSWLRDGAFIADALSRAGAIAPAEAFFGWCAGVVTARAARIEDLLARHAAGQSIEHAEFLPTRYTVDGDEVEGEWWDFQLDGYGAWLWSLDAHATRHNRPVEPYLAGAILSARYAAGLWTHPSYDWWEEHAEHLHISTLAAIWAGLRAVAGWPGVPSETRAGLADSTEAVAARIRDEAARAGHLVKWVGSDAVDASLLAVATPFGVLDPHDPLMAATVAAVETSLVHDRGVHRYAHDTYYGGGEWPLLAGFLGWHYARSGRTDDAEAELVWIAAQATPEGDLPEQVAECLLDAEHRAGWLRRWGPVATPLLWSHAMYLTLALELGVVTPGDLG